jgi:phosphoenolpyruvate carboxykinase (GTP)
MNAPNITTAPSETALPVTGHASSNGALRRWVQECAALTRAAAVHWCDGSDDEAAALTREAVAQGVLLPLDPAQHPDSFLHRSDPRDTSRTEACTYICTPTQAQAGPTNNWMAPEQAYHMLRERFAGAMQGRTLYVIPFLMGHPGSPLVKVGVELTDSLYVVLNMRIMTRMGRVALQELGDRADFTRCLHALGTLNPAQRAICHFPQDNTVWSYGSGYGGNALLGKKCLALRIGSALGQQQGWLAEHMLIMGVTEPTGRTTYLTGAFPSACGKTNLAMLTPPEPFRRAGWTVTTVGDDIAWMSPDAQGALRAVNPEAGYFGVVPGTNTMTNPNAVASMARKTIFTNVALLPNSTVWWEGKDGPIPAACTDWTGQAWTPASGRKAAHPNSRFTAPLTHNPALSPVWNDPAGVPVSAIIFGGRRAHTVPLMIEALDWTHGVYLGATLGSETTAAATGDVGVVRRDPMAMLPFCGYAVGAYFAHWLAIGQQLKHPPKIFFVNWFRKDAQGRFLWPGFGENMRLLQWIVDRCQGRVDAIRTPLGWMPRPEDVDLRDMPDGRARFEQAQTINPEEWQREARAQAAWLAGLGPDVPRALLEQADRLIRQLS